MAEGSFESCYKSVPFKCDCHFEAKCYHKGCYVGFSFSDSGCRIVGLGLESEFRIQV